MAKFKNKLHTMSVQDFIDTRAPEFARGVEGYNPVRMSHEVDAKLSTKDVRSKICRDTKHNFLQEHLNIKKIVPAPNAYSIKITPVSGMKQYTYDRTTYFGEVMKDVKR